VPGSTPAVSPRSSSVCPAVNRAAAAVLSAANSTSSWAEPRCSIEREPRRQAHTICTAVAPEAVFTVRTNATSAVYGPTLVFKFRRVRTRNSTSTDRDHARPQILSQVRALPCGLAGLDCLSDGGPGLPRALEPLFRQCVVERDFKLRVRRDHA
jgi:hypothetical protein